MALELKDILPIAIGAVIAIWQFAKSHKLQKKSHEIEKKNLELQQKILEIQQGQDFKKELEPAKQKYEEIIQGQSDAKNYCHHIYDKFKLLDFTGLNAILQKPLLLEEVYVRLRAKKSLGLEHYHSIKDFKALDKEKEKTEEGDLDFVTVFTALYKKSMKKREPLRAVILGHPGSGKTTLMKWIALQCACAKTQSFFTDFTPVFISLKDLGRDPEHTFQKYNILDLTQAQLTHETCSPSFIKERFEASRLIILLDGLDEVADEEIRRQVIGWIQKQNIRNNTLLVTSRFSGLQESKGLKFNDMFQVFTILDFEIADIECFLENWYKSIEIAVAGSDGEQEEAVAEQKGRSQYKDLMTTIKNEKYKNLRKLAVNPLLLTIIAIVHRTRAVLPKERHELYKECLKVLIELWNVANRKINVSFSEINCMINLAKLAVALMKENRREMQLTEIEKLLPDHIQGQTLDFFLNEMVLKAGLLYSSEGKYGFLHLTFQEYLAAWSYAISGDLYAILEYRDKDYWTETFKLYVNLLDPRPFFDEIITNLESKGYWLQMQLWDDCLWDIVAEEFQKEIELKFAKRVLAILPGIEYKEENESLMMQLFAHYPLYKLAPDFVDNAWLLFREAKHPFVQSMGSSILNKAGEEHQVALMAAIKKRVVDFEAEPHSRPEQLLDYIYQNNNSFVLLIAGRKNLTDFNFSVSKLKSVKFFLLYLDLIDLLDLRDLLDLIDIRDLTDIQDLRNLRNLRLILGFSDIRDIRDILDIPHIRNLQYRRDLRYLRYLRELLDKFLEKYETVIKEHKPEIDAWADKAIGKLRTFTDEELLKYFPNTTAEEITRFRDQGKDSKQ